MSRVGSDLNRDLEREISADAVTVIKNDDMVLPLNPKADEKVLLLGAYDNELPGMELGMRRLIAEGVLPENVQYESIRYNSATTIDDLKSAIDSSDYVIVISEVGSAAQLLGRSLAHPCTYRSDRLCERSRKRFGSDEHLQAV